jgi:hypothetical protein
MTRKALTAVLFALSCATLAACMGQDPVGPGSNGQDNQATGISTSPSGPHH